MPAVLYAIAQLERVRCRGIGVTGVERDETGKKTVFSRKVPDNARAALARIRKWGGGHRIEQRIIFLQNVLIGLAHEFSSMPGWLRVTYTCLPSEHVRPR